MNILAFTLLQKPVQEFVNDFLNQVYELKLNYPETEKELNKIILNFRNLLNKYPINEQCFLVSLLLSHNFLKTYFRDIPDDIELMLGQKYLNDLFINFTLKIDHF